jgi:hypothetical protein
MVFQSRQFGIFFPPLHGGNRKSREVIAKPRFRLLLHRIPGLLRRTLLKMSAFTCSLADRVIIFITRAAILAARGQEGKLIPRLRRPVQKDFTSMTETNYNIFFNNPLSKFLTRSAPNGNMALSVLINAEES